MKLLQTSRSITGNFTVGTYGGRNDVLLSTSPGPPNFGQNGRGKNFFCGGPGTNSTASQIIDLSPVSSIIDGGKVKFVLSGWLGGFETNDDNPTLIAVFNDRNRNPIGQATVGPVKAQERSNATSLVFKQETGQIPVGSRSVIITMSMERVAGQLNDAYADNINFSMEQPNSVALQTGISTTSNAAIPNVGSSGSSSTPAVISVGTTNTNAQNNSRTSNSSGNNSFAAGFGSFLGNFVAAMGNANTGNLAIQNRNASLVTGISRSRGRTIISLNSDVLFNNGDWKTIKPLVEQELDQLKRNELAGRQVRSIIFEGHTDEMSTSMDNITLSTMRVLTLTDWMIRHGVSPSLVEVRGLGSSMPKTSNINGINRADNKRVEIVVIE